VTRRPSPSGRKERSLRTQKDDETVEGMPVFRNGLSFAGGVGNEDLDQHDKPSTTVSQKERRREARRRTLQVFRGNGLATRRARQGHRGGELTQCAGPSLGSVGPDGFQRPATLAARGFAPSCRDRSAYRTWLTSPEGNMRKRKRNAALRGVSVPLRVRMMALVGCARTSNLICRSR